MKQDQLQSWPTSAAFTARERATLALAEQIVIDVTGVTDHDVSELRDHMSDAEAYALVNAIYLIEYTTRVELALARVLSEESP